MPNLCPALARYSQPESGSKGTRATTFVPTPATRSTPLTSDAGGYHDTNEAEDNVARTIIMSAPTWRGRPLDEPEPKVSLRGDAPQPGFLMQWGWALLGAAMLATIVGIIMVSAYQTNSPRNPPVPKAVPK